jgi:pilus assembly protein Flp/PilA
MKDAILKFFRDEEGLTTVEYAIAGSLIALAVVAAFTGLGDAVAAAIEEITGVITGA